VIVASAKANKEASQTRELLRRRERGALRGSLRSFTRANAALFQDDNASGCGNLLEK
jgi:hypothetical protein